MFRYLLPLCLALGAFIVAACSSSGEGGRVVNLTQTDDGCTPAVITGTPGEKLNLKVENTTGKDYEVEGIEGTQLEEVVIPEGRTRDVGYTIPSEGGTFKIKCYVPGDVSTILEVHAGDSTSASATTAASASASGSPAADSSVTVNLIEYSVTPSSTTLDAGNIQFNAKNNSTSQVHELAVLRTKADGTPQNLGEVEDIDPGAGGSVTINLTPGKYTFACLIVPGEAGSTTDHFQQGMHTEVTVK
jgi:uncharacterized cupredoxin-like copper-binding protein